MKKNEKVTLLTEIWNNSIKQNTLAIYNDLIFIKEKNKFIIVGNELHKKVNCLYIDSVFSGIRSFSFVDCKYLKEVKLGYNCKFIDDYAFYGSSIKTIYCNKGLKTIGKYCFSSSSISNFHFEGDLQILDDYAFYDCKSLKTINLGNKLKFVGKGIFKDCLKLVNAQISGTFSVLKEETFYNCKSLKTFTCCYSISTLDDRCFFNCSKLQYIVTTTNLSQHEHQVFTNCDNLKDYIIFGLDKKMTWTLYKYGEDYFDKLKVIAITFNNEKYIIGNKK